MFDKTYNHKSIYILSDGRQIENPENYKLYLLSDEFVRVIRNVAQQVSERPFHFYQDVGKTYFKTVSQSQFDAIQAYMAEGIGELMTGIELIAALECICDAIKNINIGVGGGSPPFLSDDTSITGRPIYGTEEPKSILDIPLGQFPLGEADPAYNAYKCLVANTIVTGLVATLNNLSLWSLAELTIGGVALGLIFALAGSVLTLPVLAVVAGAMVFLGLTTATFGTWANQVEANRQELVNAMYCSDTATEAYNAVVSIVINLTWSGLDLGYIEDLFMQIVPLDFMNRLFDGVGLPQLDPANNVTCYCSPPNVYCYDFSEIDATGWNWYTAAGEPGNISHNGTHLVITPTANMFNYFGVSGPAPSEGAGVAIDKVVITFYHQSNQAVGYSGQRLIMGGSTGTPALANIEAYYNDEHEITFEYAAQVITPNTTQIGHLNAGGGFWPNGAKIYISKICIHYEEDIY